MFELLNKDEVDIRASSRRDKLLAAMGLDKEVRLKEWARAQFENARREEEQDEIKTLEEIKAVK